MSDKCDTESAAIVQMLLRLLHHSLARPQALSSHPAAAAPRFRLLLLALRCGVVGVAWLLHMRIASDGGRVWVLLL